MYSIIIVTQALVRTLCLFESTDQKYAKLWLIYKNFILSADQGGIGQTVITVNQWYDNLIKWYGIDIIGYPI